MARSFKALLAAFTALLLISCNASSSDDPWARADRILATMTRVSFPDRSVDITDFGAVPGDSTKLATEAIANAILAMNQAGGGVVIVPEGTFWTGPITLKSNVNLHLADGAVLKFSTDVKQYFPAVPSRWEGIDCNNTHPLIYAYGETNIALTGNGTIDGCAAYTNWWGRGQWTERRPWRLNRDDPNSPMMEGSRVRLLAWGESGAPMYERTYTEVDGLRPQTIHFNRCTTVLIEGVTLLNSPFWVIHPLMCNDLTIRGITANNNGPNGDGCDPESCKNVLIEDCVFNTGDDCIAIKSGRNEDGRKWGIPSENIIVRNCTMANGHGGVVIGSEISGGFRGLFVENCKMDSPNLDRVIRIKTSTARGGVIEDIHVRNVEVGQCREAVLRINLKYEMNEIAKRGFIPEVRDVTLENVTCQKSTYGVRFDGLDEEVKINDITLRNCSFEGVQRDAVLQSGLVGQVTFDNTTVNGKAL
jgi:polygalacturonase